MANARRGVSDNVYTVLLFATVVALGCGVGYLAYRSNELFGNFNPLSAKPLAGSILPFFGG
jgi:hypothetical protein